MTKDELIQQLTALDDYFKRFHRECWHHLLSIDRDEFNYQRGKLTAIIDQLKQDELN